MKTSKSVNTAKPTCDIIVVTYNNHSMLDRCLLSIYQNTGEPVRLIVVNNGDQGYEVPPDTGIIVLNIGKNIGWTQGVNVGLKWVLKNNPANFIMWLNDDTQILPHDYGWLTKMINCFQLDPKIGAVGPTSNNVMGFQTTNHTQLPPAIETTFLSGMCILTRLSIVEEMGPLDACEAGGDDLDFSMRLRQKGYKICVCRRSFVLHFCSVTGRKLYGEYWNSQEQGEAINTWLIKKHGFKPWFMCVNNLLTESGGTSYDFVGPEEKLALEELVPILEGGGKVLDLGCGGKKIHKDMVGVDIRGSKDQGVGANRNIPSAADIEADILDLPMADGSVDGILAKHLFEHILDPIRALREWRRVLKDDGKLVIICPDYRFCEAISVDPSHVHAYTPDSVCSLLSASGDWKLSRIENVTPGYVFMVSAEKLHVPDARLVEESLCGV